MLSKHRLQHLNLPFTITRTQGLWCVYEAYLGACWKKTCIMPARPHTSTQCGTIRQTLVAPMAAGVLSGMFWWFILSHTDDRDDNFLLVAIVMLLCATGTAVCFVVSILLKFCRWSWQTHFKFVRIGHMLLLFLCTLSFLPWLSFKRDERILPFAFDYFQHYFFPIVLILFNLLRIVQLNQHELELKAPSPALCLSSTNRTVQLSDPHMPRTPDSP